MFDKKGQSALEYLMTYGWALAVLIVVVALLVILVGTPSGGDTCSGSMKFPIPSLSDSGGNLVLVVTNATGQTIKSTDFNAGSNQASGVPNPWSAGLTGQGITFTGLVAAGNAYSVDIHIEYVDKYSNTHSESVTCNGTAD